MSTSQSSASGRSSLAGGMSAAFGLSGIAALVWLWMLTATPIDPANWVRILGLAFLPVGVVGAVIAGISGLRGAGRRYALVGLSAAAVTVIGFVLLITIYG